MKVHCSAHFEHFERHDEPNILDGDERPDLLLIQAFC